MSSELKERDDLEIINGVTPAKAGAEPEIKIAQEAIDGKISELLAEQEAKRRIANADRVKKEKRHIEMIAAGRTLYERRQAEERVIKYYLKHSGTGAELSEKGEKESK